MSEIVYKVLIGHANCTTRLFSKFLITSKAPLRHPCCDILYVLYLQHSLPLAHDTMEHIGLVMLNNRCRIKPLLFLIGNKMDGDRQISQIDAQVFYFCIYLVYYGRFYCRETSLGVNSVFQTFYLLSKLVLNQF